MRNLLQSVALVLLLASCGGNGADLVRGGTWKVAKWTVTIDNIFDGSGNMPATKTTKTASQENVGTLAFAGAENDSATGASGQLTRHLMQRANTSTTEPSFNAQPLDDVVEWDHGDKMPENIYIYDGTNEDWNGAWKVTGGGSDVTLTRGIEYDDSPTQHRVHTHVFHLVR